MSKYLPILVALACMVAATVATARPSRVKTVPVQWTAAVVDNQVVITTTTPKQGSRFTDTWTGVTNVVGTQKVDTDGEATYVSQATLAPAASGVSTVTYQITMTPGKSRVVQFVGSVTISLDVTVADDGTVTLNSAA